MSEKELTEEELEKASGGKRTRKANKPLNEADMEAAAGGKRSRKVSDSDLEQASGGRRARQTSEPLGDGNETPEPPSTGGGPTWTAGQLPDATLGR